MEGRPGWRGCPPILCVSPALDPGAFSASRGGAKVRRAVEREGSRVAVLERRGTNQIFVEVGEEKALGQLERILGEYPEMTRSREGATRLLLTLGGGEGGGG